MRQAEPVLRSNLLEGEREVIVMCPEVLDSTEYGYMLISSTCPICSFIMRVPRT
jgi:hypothetical protein